MIHRIPITQARINLGAIVKRAHLNKEYFVLEKDGIPIAGLMNADEMEDYLELQDPKLKKQIKEGYEAYLRGEGRDLDEFLAELKEEMKAAEKKKK